MEKIEYSKIVEIFARREFTYFLTIKPDSSKLQHIEGLLEYLRKRNHYYWIVLCESPNGYKHFHGVLSVQSTAVDIKKTKATIQRKINRDLGFLYPLQQVTNLRHLYDYVRAPNNKNIEEWYTNKVNY